MNDASASLSQVELLKQRLQAAKAALEELNADHDAKLKALAQFIANLSLACKGQSIELDNRLAKLRCSLGNYDALDEVLPELPETERLLKNQYHHVMSRLEQGRASLAHNSRDLQRIEALPDKLTKELIFYRQELSKPFHSLWDYMPKVEQLLGYYEQLLAQRLDIGEKLSLQPKHQQLAQELTQLLEQMDFHKQQREQIQTMTEQLAGELDVEGLLEIYQNLLQLMLENLAREKILSQEFLQALNASLSSVRDIVSDAYTQAQHSQQLKQQLNQETNQRLQQALLALSQTNELVSLKQQLLEHLTALSTQQGRKETLEQREIGLLRQSVETLRRELSNLSAETASYKERLFEQQRMNLLDSLTQLPNRAALDERMEQEFRHFQRHKNSLWVAVADIDHFKAINDSFGHSTGDKTLQVIAMALKNSLRDTEFVARYGGEEFVMLIPEVSNTDIGQLLNRVREKIKNIPFKFKNQRITVTLSIGAAQMLNGEHILDTFERADAALYKAKHESRDRVIID